MKYLILLLLFILMSLININNSNDSNFRYKINSIEIQYTGLGNGCFTNLTNINLIATQINHNPKTLIKYIGICLGSKVNDDKYWIQGHHPKDKIQNYIFDFIKCYVICQKCSIPELEYNFEKHNKNEIINIHCIGCGYNYSIDSFSLNKNNKKIFDKVLNDIKNNIYNKSIKTTKLEQSQENFILEENQDFF